ncbi:hypothetical protein [Actinoplanes campanulatus]|nr:hypothetical protein [Actinoplanes capillaceus]
MITQRSVRGSSFTGCAVRTSKPPAAIDGGGRAPAAVRARLYERLRRPA